MNLYPVPLQNIRTPVGSRIPIGYCCNILKKISPNVRELLISEGVQVPQILPTETNYQGNQRLLLVRNAAVEA